MIAKASQEGISLGEDQVVYFDGDWTLPQLADLERRLADFAWPASPELIWDLGGIQAIDTGGAWLLQRTLDTLQQKGRRVALRRLSPAQAELMQMVARSGSAIQFSAPLPRMGGLERIGRLVWREGTELRDALAFLGESVMRFFFTVAHPRTLRGRALLKRVELDGFNALPIIGLLLFLVGTVIAYQGAEQLRALGANIYVVDLVGIALLREVAPLITAIVIAGRSGAAYTAEIGTMKVTEELDAMRTIGLSPMELLVIPRITALVISLPLLTVFGDLIGVFGGMLVSYGQLGIRFDEFISRFREAIALRHYLIGIGKAPVFAIIIALVGCYQGFQVRGSVESVGRNTTTSVVQAIFLVIVFDALFSILLSWWKL
ncbi:MAG: MlaE family lipid ABC transporter permease subunit [Candidatus Manganitrophus sp.]|nr:MAG: MlaE family lipid ABC transporter permease subunit [Candidatus Manganitrophus sp.]